MESVLSLHTICLMAQNIPSVMPHIQCQLLRLLTGGGGTCSGVQSSTVSCLLVRSSFQVRDGPPTLAHSITPALPNYYICLCSHQMLGTALYEYFITFRVTKAHSSADALSRLPLPLIHSKSPPELMLLTSTWKNHLLLLKRDNIKTI